MRARSFILLVVGLVAGILIGSQLRSATASSVPCVQATATRIPVAFLTPIGTPFKPPKSSNVLLTIAGDATKQTADFRAASPFVIHWTAAYSDPTIRSMVLGIQLYDGTRLQDYITTQKPGANQSIEHVDCSKGCYLKVTDLFATYRIIVTR